MQVKCKSNASRSLVSCNDGRSRGCVRSRRVWCHRAKTAPGPSHASSRDQGTFICIGCLDRINNTDQSVYSSPPCCWVPSWALPLHVVSLGQKERDRKPLFSSQTISMSWVKVIVIATVERERERGREREGWERGHACPRRATAKEEESESELLESIRIANALALGTRTGATIRIHHALL